MQTKEFTLDSGEIWEFPKNLGYFILGVLIIRILVFRVLLVSFFVSITPGVLPRSSVTLQWLVGCPEDSGHLLWRTRATEELPEFDGSFGASLRARPASFFREGSEACSHEGLQRNEAGDEKVEASCVGL